MKVTTEQGTTDMHKMQIYSETLFEENAKYEGIVFEDFVLM